jgi:hypothetical protein
MDSPAPGEIREPLSCLRRARQAGDTENTETRRPRRKARDSRKSAGRRRIHRPANPVRARRRAQRGEGRRAVPDGVWRDDEVWKGKGTPTGFRCCRLRLPPVETGGYIWGVPMGHGLGFSPGDEFARARRNPRTSFLPAPRACLCGHADRRQAGDTENTETRRARRKARDSRESAGRRRIHRPAKPVGARRAVPSGGRTKRRVVPPA